MKENYVEILKEQIMQNLLGNNALALKELAENLIKQNKLDVKEISQAYFIVNREIFGDPTTN